ncbi:ROK family transcriptional regulator [Subtercola vilae]|uniref:ROK family protein n=1 Tax=Subtercola vilae TaxID=2056433 RepID=A0A4V4RF67_9MICO|nr:ROK family transcriptional regulator [Subtercola vilae]TIH36614.1 ROK family protein [Subtercola vilae]
MPALQPAAMRKLNQGLTSRALYGSPALTMAQLLELTSLSRRTTEAILSDLVESGWVRETPPSPGQYGAGRPPRFFEFKPDNRLLIGVQIDLVSVTAVVADVRGSILGRRREQVDSRESPEETTRVIASAIKAVLRTSGRTKNSVIACTIASGGTISDDGYILSLPNEPAWSNVSIGVALADTFDFPIFTENDANLAALGEQWQGAAQAVDTFIWLIPGQLQGAGIVIRNQIYRGVNGGAGEIVHAETLGFGDIQNHPLSYLTSPDPALRGGAELIVAAARRGDAAALGLFDEFAQVMSGMLRTLSWTLAPPLIVLGGGVEVAGELLVSRLSAEMERTGAPGVELRASSLGGDAVLVGAVKYALDRSDVEIFGPLVR